MAILRCKEPFSCTVGGVPRVVTAGTLLDSDDPVVKGREKLFEPVDAFVSRATQPVEQATAAPGEKRARRVSTGKASKGA